MEGKRTWIITTDMFTLDSKYLIFTDSALLWEAQCGLQSWGGNCISLPEEQKVLARRAQGI
jgi:hypothetical protein